MTETNYGSRLPGQLALRQVGKEGRTVQCHMQVFGRPGQLVLWQVGLGAERRSRGDQRLHSPTA
jgi:hypothetical protein